MLRYMSTYLVIESGGNGEMCSGDGTNRRASLAEGEV